MLCCEIIAAQSSRFEAESFGPSRSLGVLVNSFFDGLVHRNPTKWILFARSEQKILHFQAEHGHLDDRWIVGSFRHSKLRGNDCS